MSLTLHFEQLSREHDRERFCCGEESLDNYLKRLANQQAERFLGRTFVATPGPGETRIVGYYTLAAAQIDITAVPGKGLGMPFVPAVLLGRLAVDNEFKGQGVGGDLLINALARSHRISRADVGIYAVLVHALHDKAKAFYLHYGFEELLDDPLHLFMPMRRIEKLGLLPTN